MRHLNALMLHKQFTQNNSLKIIVKKLKEKISDEKKKKKKQCPTEKFNKFDTHLEERWEGMSLNLLYYIILYICVS